MRIKEGIVTSSKMEKTVVVTVHRYKMHPKYKKKYRVSKKFLAHNPENAAKEGDKVAIVETKPLSKLKRWRVVSQEELQTLVQAQKDARQTEVQSEPDDIVTVMLESRKRAKNRGTRLKEKQEPAAAPAAPAAPAADAAPQA